MSVASTWPPLLTRSASQRTAEPPSADLPAAPARRDAQRLHAPERARIEQGCDDAPLASARPFAASSDGSRGRPATPLIPTPLPHPIAMNTPPDPPASPDAALTLRPVGTIRSPLQARRGAPRQGSEGAPDVWLEIEPWAQEALLGLAVGDELFVITWLHQGRREVFQVVPRRGERRGLTGVFATRSPDRPNPLGLHPVTLHAIEGLRLRIGPIEAIDGTPVVDIKPVLK